MQEADKAASVSAEDIAKLIERAQQEPGYNDYLAVMNLANEVAEFQVEQRSVLVPATVVSSASGTLTA